MNKICNKCQALKWNKESKGFCCQNGQVVLAPLSPGPPCLYNLFTSNDPISNEPYVNPIKNLDTVSILYFRMQYYKYTVLQYKVYCILHTV